MIKKIFLLKYSILLMIIGIIFFGLVNSVQADSSDSSLSALVIDQGTLTPDFDSATFSYIASVANDVLYFYITPTTNDSNATIEVNGDLIGNEDTYEVALDVGENTINIIVTAQDGTTTSDYEIVVTREASNLLLLHEFVGGSDGGSYPNGNLTFYDSKLYGMTYYGGDLDLGTIFSINTDGTGFTLLHSFAGGADDGSNPEGSLYLSGSKLYGMTYYGGDLDLGTIFSINTDGTGFTLLHSFAGGADDGRYVYSYLILSGTKLYGMTGGGGDSDRGTIFSINTDGTGFTLLHEFSGGNDDGSDPYGPLILSGSTLYGMTAVGGGSDLGTIFSINTDGTGFTLLHEFSGGSDDGSYSWGSLILSGPTLYGMTYAGGGSDLGTIFSINTDGTGFTLFHSFAGGADDGSYPYGSLILSDSTLYGMTSDDDGGDFLGTIFSINTDGTGFTLLHSFAGGADDGSYPYGSLILSDSTLYGMTSMGGDSDLGTIFSLAGVVEEIEEESNEDPIEEPINAHVDSWKVEQYENPNTKCTQRLKLTLKGKHFENDSIVKIGNSKASSVDKKGNNKLVAKFCLTKLLNIKTNLKRTISVTNPDADTQKAKKKIDLSEYIDNNNNNNNSNINTHTEYFNMYTNEGVKHIQEVLNRLGYLDAENITGVYGPITTEAVRKFQQDNNIDPASGYVGDLTRKKLGEK